MTITSTLHKNGVVEVFDADAYKVGNPNADIATCGHCNRSWDDAHVSSLTPTPSARCPFEYEHEYPQPKAPAFVNGTVNLTRLTRVYYSVRLTRDDAVYYLTDAGADEDAVNAMSDADLINALISGEYADEIGDTLDDVSSETDSGSDPWEVA